MNLRVRLLLASSLVALAACGSSSSGGPSGAAGSSNDGGETIGDMDAGGGTSTSPGSPSSPSSSGSTGSSGAGGSSSGSSGGGTSSSSSGAGATSGDASAPASRKRGLAYGSNSNADLAALSKGIGWWYNWSSSPDSTLTADWTSSGVEYVPMIWGGTFNTTTLATQVPASAKYLLTFNEPNFGAQSNLTPQQAAALWPQIEAFAASKNLKIVSPALNYCGGSCNETNPFTWLTDFFAACTGCRVDYIGAHWYACTKSALQGYLSDYETKFTQDIWLTEFSCLDGSLAATDANEETYMTAALALLECDPRIFRYSWFTGRSTGSPAISVLGDSGVLTALGQSYVTLPQ